MVTILEMIKTADVEEMKSQLTAMQAELAATVKERECDINLMRMLVEAAGVAQSKGRDGNPMGRVPEIAIASTPVYQQDAYLIGARCSVTGAFGYESSAENAFVKAAIELPEVWEEMAVIPLNTGTIVSLSTLDSFSESNVSAVDPVPVQPPTEATKATREVVAVPVIQHAKQKTKPATEAATSLTVADRAMIYLQAAGAPCTAMGIAGGLGLPVPSTLVKVLESDERFEKNAKGFWTLKG